MLIPENVTLEIKVDYLAIGLIAAAVLLVMIVKYKVLQKC